MKAEHEGLPAGPGASPRDEGLLQFLYLAPIALIQARRDGTIELCNPMSIQYLIPIAPGGRLENLFDALSVHVPELAKLVEAHPFGSGNVCSGLRFAVPDARNATVPLIYSLHVTPIDDDRVMAVITDVSLEVERERIDVERRLHDVARIDALTAMPNRLAAIELIDRALFVPDSGRCAVLLIGGERLQQLANSFGHAVREQVLNVMALRLSNILRPVESVDVLGDAHRVVARVGSDEFAIVLQRLDRSTDAEMIAQRALDALAQPYVIAGVPLQCTVSIGIAGLCDRGDGGAEGVLRDAAIALGESARAGGSRLVKFDSGMRERVIRRGNLEVELRHAVAHDELFVVYQPVVHLQRSERPAGVEALVRWRHPVHGIVSPVEFIAIAEEAGLIGAIGQYVLDTACRDFAAWSDEFGEHSPQLLAVNLSRAQLDDPHLVASVQASVTSAGVAMGRLQLEITESLAAQDDDIRSQLHALKSLGLTLALDDFGTGYSSLSSLHLLPVDTVKIDRSFVTLLEHSPHHRVLIEATIKVARSLSMTTVAEGIESTTQSHLVRDLGCEKGQGYLFGRPLSACDMRSWLVRHAEERVDPGDTAKAREATVIGVPAHAAMSEVG